METLLFLMASINAGKTISLFECAEKAQEQQQQEEQPFTIKPKLTGENKCTVN
jgi:thymidine kinase